MKSLPNGDQPIRHLGSTKVTKTISEMPTVKFTSTVALFSRGTKSFMEILELIRHSKEAMLETSPAGDRTFWYLESTDLIYIHGGQSATFFEGNLIGLQLKWKMESE